jgi:uncharacterized membrane protein
MCSVAIAAVTMVWLGMPEEWLPVAGMSIPAAFGTLAFLWERKQVARTAPAADQIREADLLADDDRLPRWIALALPPFVLPLAVAVWLRAHWDSIPARSPIHWDIDNVANGWSDKSVRGVFGPLMFAGGLMLSMVLLTLAMFYGSRRGRQRTAVAQMMVASVYLLGFVFSAVAVMPVVQFSPDVLVIAGILCPVVLLIWVARMVSTWAIGWDG